MSTLSPSARCRIESRRLINLAVALGLHALSPAQAVAQTWLDPTSGSWSVASNWLGGVAPLPSATTRLRFNATGALSYTATNDILTGGGDNAFALNALELDTDGATLVCLDGNPLSFTGTGPNITQSGTGAAAIANALILPAAAGQPTPFLVNATHLTLAGPLTSAIAPTTTTGAYLSVAGEATLSGGANVLSLTARGGHLRMSGGPYTLSSTLRRNDTLASDSGPWSLNIGESATGADFTQTGGSIVAAQGFINVGAPGSGTTEAIEGTWTISGANTSAVFGFGDPSNVIGRFGILQGNGTINVTDGARLAGRLFEVGRQSVENESDRTVNVSGLGSRIEAHQLVTRAGGRATLTISGGGVIDLTPVDATGSTGMGLLVLGAGGTFFDPLPGQAVFRVNGEGSVLRAVQSQFGGGLSAATMSISAGGAYRANAAPDPNLMNEATFLGDADTDPTGNDNTTGFGAIHVDGPGSIYDQSTPNGGLIVMGGGGGSTQGGDALVTVTNGGELRANDLTVAQDRGSDGTLLVSGGGSFVNVIATGGGTHGMLRLGQEFSFFNPAPATGTVVLSDGGALNTVNADVGGGVFDALGNEVPGGLGWISVSSGARMTVTDTLRMGATTEGRGTLLIGAGGTVSVGNSALLSVGTQTSSLIAVTGGTLLVGASMTVGGTGTNTTGLARVTIDGGGFISIGAGTTGTSGPALLVSPTGTLTIGAGTSSPGTLLAGPAGMTVDGGTVLFNAGTLRSAGTLSVVSGGKVLLSPAARNASGEPSNRKTPDVGGCTISSGGLIDLNDNDLLVRGSASGQPRSEIEQLIASARNGGAWDQPGLTSTAARLNAQQATTLGVLDAADYVPLHGASFNGLPVTSGDVLVKYTWYGDADFNGLVDYDDYVRIDLGFNTLLTGWFNGDFDYSGDVNFDDYVLIDLGFNAQNGTLQRARTFLDGTDRSRADMTAPPLVKILDHFDRFGTGYATHFLSAVPEPGDAIIAIALMSAAPFGYAHRRQARRNS